MAETISFACSGDDLGRQTLDPNQFHTVETPRHLARISYDPRSSSLLVMYDCEAHGLQALTTKNPGDVLRVTCSPNSPGYEEAPILSGESTLDLDERPKPTLDDLEMTTDRTYDLTQFFRARV